MALLYMFPFLLSVVAAYLVRCQSSRARARAREQQILHPECQPASHYPHLDPFLGLDLVFKTIKLVGRNQAIEALQQHHATYGKTYVVNSFGQSVYYTTDARNFETVYSTRCTDWGVQPARLDALEPFCGRGFITTDGEAWKYARDSISAAFNNETSDISQTFVKMLERTLELLPVHGQEVDLQPVMAHFFFNIAGEFLIGRKFDTVLESPFLRAYRESIAWLQIRVFFGVVGRNIPNLSFKRNCKKVHSVVDQNIDRAIEEADARKSSSKEGMQQLPTSVLDSLAAVTTDQNTWRSQIIQCIMAMQDTTSTLVTNTIFLLSRHPTIWVRLRDEVLHSELDSGSATKLKNMKLLQNVLKESLRMYPVFATDGRTSLCDTVLPRGGGPDGDHAVFIPRDSRVITVFYGLHRDPKVFGPNVDEFDPDRWNCIEPKAWEFLPFSGGARCCAGREMATNQAAFAVARLAQRYTRVESKDERSWAGRWSLTWTNGNGCKVAFYEK